jgi:hypothetical protein
MRQQPWNSVAAHRSHDVGIMDLFSPDRSRLQHVEQESRDGGILIGTA